MSESLVSDAINIYWCAETLSIIPKKINFPELHNYVKSIRNLQDVLGESSEDEFWKPIIRQMKYLSFLFTAIPLNLDELNSELDFVLQKITENQPICKIQYPSVYHDFKMTIQSLTNLSKVHLDLLRNSLNTLISELEGTIGILINGSRFLPTLNQQFDNNVEVIVSRSLSRQTVYDNIILIGTIGNRWFPEYILSAPRATNIYVLYFKWFHGQWKTENVFPNSIIGHKLNQQNNSEFGTLEEADSIDPEFLLPEFDFSYMISKAWNSYEENKNDEEFVEAIIGYLENDQIVFLDVDDSSEIRIIDVEDEETPIKKIKVKDVIPDMFVLLKTSGGGDYIVPIADSIMGTHASELRTIQKKWKDGLRNLYYTNGCDWLVKELKEKGCEIANYMNIRNWMSYRSIKTRNFKDFKTILEVIGMAESPEEVWEKMNLITQAHRKAGFHITNLLLMEAKKMDFDDLVSQGMMELVLPDKDAGSITAFRIKALSDKTDSVLVSPHKINIPMDVDE